MQLKIVKSWDELPPVVFDQGEAFSTRVLEKQYRDMEAKIQRGTKLHLGSGEFISCPECQKLVDHVHSLQQDRLYLSKKLQAIRQACTTEPESKMQFVARILLILDEA